MTKYKIQDMLAMLSIIVVSLAITLFPVSLYKFGINSMILPSTELCLLYFFAMNYSVWYLTVFLYGIFISEIYNTPIGVESLFFVVAYCILAKNRSLLLSRRPTYLLGFIVMLIFIELGEYLLISNYYSVYFSLKTLIIKIIITILFFPSIDWIMSTISQKVWCDAK